MRAVVWNTFTAFTERFEGRTDWLYLDVRGLVTIGLGNLVDPLPLALNLPFIKLPTRKPASASDVANAWHAVKAAQARKLRGGGAFADLTNIRLTAEGLDHLVSQKLTQFETQLLFHFPEFGEWPAKAQLATLSMAWAMGGNFPASWPHFTEACLGCDWTAAAANCRMRDADNPGLRPRNAANIALFRDAANPYDCAESLD